MKHLRTVFTCLAVAGLAACASQPAPVSVADTIARTPNLTTLNTLIVQAGMGEALKAQGPFTVFAPSNDAFKALPPAALAELGKDPARLKAVLSYHVVPGKLNSTDIKNMTVKTIGGADLSLAKAGEFVTVDDAAVQTPDVAATNGVVHVIDQVLNAPRR